MFGQQATSRLAQATLCTVALNRPADFLRRGKTHANCTGRFAAPGFDQDHPSGRTETRAHKQKLCAFGQSLDGLGSRQWAVGS